MAKAEMRHGRKSRRLLVDGYKRHVWRDLDSRLIVAVGVTPANMPEASVSDAIAADLAAQQCTLRALHIDRASLASTIWAVFPKNGLPAGLGTARTALSGRRDDAV